MPLRAVALFCMCVLLFRLPPSHPTVAAEELRPVGRAAELIARGLLSDGLRGSQAEIDLRKAYLPRESLGEVFADLMNDAPELFYVENRLSYTYDAEGTVLTVTPVYRMTGAELEEARNFWQETLTRITEDLYAAKTARHVVLTDGETGGWSEADTVLFLHDYLAETYDYDTAGNNFDAYSLFRDGVGVCQAYALAFMAVGRAAGLEVDMVTSRKMDHAWNHVRVDGVWYHVDVTRDDPIREPGTASIVRHGRLLRSDAGMELAGYTGFSCRAGGQQDGAHTCVSGRFETAEGTPCLDGITDMLVSLPTGWFRTGETAAAWIPISFPPGIENAPDEPIVQGTPGDMDADGRLTPADLLWSYLCFPEQADGGIALRERILDAVAGNTGIASDIQ